MTGPHTKMSSMLPRGALALLALTLLSLLAEVSAKPSIRSDNSTEVLEDRSASVCETPMVPPVGGGVCFFRTTNKKKYNGGKNQCANLGGVYAVPAIVDSQERWDAIVDNMANIQDDDYIGIKATRSGGVNTYKWFDSSVVVWSNWASNHPKYSSSSKKCAVLKTESGVMKWKSNSCTVKKHMICMFDGPWSAWSAWSVCSCAGTRTQTRTCTGSGANCPGSAINSESCTPNCPLHSKCDTGNVGGWCFWRTTSKATYNGGINKCEQDGGHGAIVDSDDKMTAIKNYVPYNYEEFIGIKGHHASGGNVYEWWDGTSVVWDQWASGLPDYDDPDKLCAVFKDDSGQLKWESYDCSSEMKMICMAAVVPVGGSGVDGGWTSFGDWSACGCDGMKTRTRTCTGSGANCPGSDTESISCNEAPFPCTQNSKCQTDVVVQENVCFWRTTSKRTYNEGKSKCEEDGGIPAVVNSQARMNAIKKKKVPTATLR